MRFHDFDYLGWWKAMVKQFQIPPIDAWSLDYIECVTISESEPKPNQDSSFMVNEQRRMNGYSRKG